MEAEKQYAQMDKNTVPAGRQLKETEFVSFENPTGQGVRILFVGNSITLHGIAPHLGWHQHIGMAASSQEKDYVHLLEAKVKEKDPTAAFCICQVASWERQYGEGESLFPLYEEARRFGADVIVLRFIENCPKQDFDGEVYKASLGRLVEFLKGDKTPGVIATTGFWHHPGDGAIRTYAKEAGLPLVELGDLGEQDCMKAVGLFAHAGVANHPGDLGMAHIADRIWQEMEPMLRN